MFNNFSVAQSFTKNKLDLGLNITGAYYFPCDWDQDGDLDLWIETGNMITGDQYPYRFKNQEGEFSLVYKGGFGETAVVTWAKFNDDNIWDFISWSSNLYYGNAGPYSTTKATRIGDIFISYAEVDNNNCVDIIVSSEYQPKLFLNNHGNFNAQTTLQLKSVAAGILNFDYDNDGDFDLVTVGCVSTSTSCSVPDQQIFFFENVGGTVTQIPVPISQNFNTHSIINYLYRDYDHDHDHDLLIAKTDSIVILRNDNGYFTPVKSFSTDGTAPNSGLFWADWFNDGFPDIITTVAVLMYDGKTWTKLKQFGSFISAFGDMDNDGDIDLLGSSFSSRSIFLNDLTTTPFEQNTPPTAPINLETENTKGIVNFSWHAPTDDTTPLQALSYNMYIGTKRGSTDIMSPLSNLTTGDRKIVAIGNVDHNTGWKIVGLPPGTYYWSVQAIDNCYEGGPFAKEQSFTISTLSIEINGTCANTPVIFSMKGEIPINYSWYFGDGTTSTKTNPSHTYSVPGTYKVSLAVRYQDGTQDTVRREVTVYGQPLKPMIAHE